MSDPAQPKGSLLSRLFGVNSPEKAEPAKAEEFLPEWDAMPAEAASPVTPIALPVAEPKAPLFCTSCRAPRTAEATFCADCGYMFPPSAAASTATAAHPSMSPMTATARLRDRYEIGMLLSERRGVTRHAGRDLENNRPVVIVSSPLPEAAEVVTTLEEPLEAVPVVEEVVPSFDDQAPTVPVGAVGSIDESWPSAYWEHNVIQKANSPALPSIIDYFVEAHREYLIEESVQGRVLWDAWDDPDSTPGIRYGWLRQIAEALHGLHQAGVILEGLRPDLVTVTSTGQAKIADLADLLPLPVPADAPIRGTLYTAPELILSPEAATGRSDLYSFGATIYSLEYLHHALEEKDFERQFAPIQITERYPDVHPLLFRLVSKTFVRDIHTRFPTDESGDASGFTELINVLEVCRRTFERVRLDIAAWTTTGMVRTGNEDAFAFLHGVESRQDDQYEYAMVLLADGMGGYEAGEVAAALAISELRKFLLKQPQFAALAGGDAPEKLDVEACKKVIEQALRHANKEVHAASRAPGTKRRGMGCTAEAVYIDAQNVVVGHVGDSRTYHLHNGRLVQLTRDQTLVNRLVELGQISAEEAENHPRKNELQQAIGGQPDVVPGLYHGKLDRCDWVLVCSDGLTNHIPSVDLEKMLTREAAGSAEEAARRLLNLVNLRGATDNATIVVVRAT